MPQKTEKIAMDVAMDYLRKEGFKPIDISTDGPGDIKYIENGKEIYVEVKGDKEDWSLETGENLRDWFLLGSEKERKFFEDNPDRFQLWCIGNLNREPRIVIIRGEQLMEWIKDRTEKREELLKIKMGKEFFDKYPSKFLKL